MMPNLLNLETSFKDFDFESLTAFILEKELLLQKLNGEALVEEEEAIPLKIMDSLVSGKNMESLEDILRIER